jgi:hypothetical protein
VNRVQASGVINIEAERADMASTQESNQILFLLGREPM